MNFNSIRTTFLLLIAIIVSLQFNANCTPPTILILDGSGSMWGQVEGKTKIEIARSVIGDLADKMDPSRPIGLVAYGHRRKGDCEDIETLLEPSTGNHAQLREALLAINPVGKTPLANTALKVIEQIKNSGESATLILVSDGAESCGGDLCEVVRAAKDAGVEFVLHIVGFDIGESDKAALECAADAGGGLYLDAENGEELSTALEQATELSIENLENTLSVKTTKDGELHNAIVRIYKPGEPKYFTSKRMYTSDKNNPGLFPLPAGNYHIEAYLLGKSKDVETQWRKDVLISSEDLKEITFDFSPGEISIKTTANEVLWDCVVHITNTEDNKMVSGGRTYKSNSSNPMIKVLSPGIYNVKIAAMQLIGEDIEHYFKNVEIKAGESTVLEHNFDYGTLSILSTNNGELWDSGYNIYATGVGKPKYFAGGRTYKSESSNPSTKLFTPGIYNIHYKAMRMHGKGWETVIEDVEVTKGGEALAKHNYESGELIFDATHDGEPLTIDVKISENGKYLFNKRRSSTQKNLIITSGKYEVEVTPIKLDAPPQLFTIELSAGAQILKSLTF